MVDTQGQRAKRGAKANGFRFESGWPAWIVRDEVTHARRDTLENSCRYLPNPATPCIFAGSSTNNRNTSSGTSHSHVMP